MRRIAFQSRERRLLIVAGLVIGSWAYISGMVQPLWDRADVLEDQVSGGVEKLQALQRLLSQRSQIEGQYEQLAEFLRDEDIAVVQGDWLQQLESLSRTCGLSLNLKPRPLRQADPISRFDVELELEGSQEELLEFLDELFALKMLVVVERLRLAVIPDKPDMLRASLVLERLILNKHIIDID